MNQWSKLFNGATLQLTELQLKFPANFWLTSLSWLLSKLFKTFFEIHTIDNCHNSFLSYFLSKMFFKTMLVFYLPIKQTTKQTKSKEE